MAYSILLSAPVSLELRLKGFQFVSCESERFQIQDVSNYYIALFLSWGPGVRVIFMYNLCIYKTSFMSTNVKLRLRFDGQPITNPTSGYYWYYCQAWVQVQVPYPSPKVDSKKPINQSPNSRFIGLSLSTWVWLLLFNKTKDFVLRHHDLVCPLDTSKTKHIGHLWTWK